MHGVSRVYEIGDDLVWEVGVDEKVMRITLAEEPEDETRPLRVAIIDGPYDLAHMDISVTAMSLLADAIDLISEVLKDRFERENDDDT